MAREDAGEPRIETHGASIKVGGRTVHLTFRLDFPSPGTITVRFVSSSGRARHALRLVATGGRLVVNGRTLDDVVLWRHTAPRVVTLQVVPSRGGCSVALRNAWEAGGKVGQSWIGGGGMLVKAEPDGLRLECSSGVGKPDFKDLVVQVGVKPA